MSKHDLTSLKLKMLFIFIFLATLPGCGGSTTGTGGVTVRGQIIDTGGNPVPNTTIIAVQGGDSTSTDESGQFQLQTEAATRLEFEIETGKQTISSSIENIPANASEVNIRITLDTEKGEAEEETLSIKEKDRDETSSSSKGNQSSKRSSSASSSSGSDRSTGSESRSSEDDSHGQSTSSKSEENSSSSSSEDDETTEVKVSGTIRSISGNLVTVESTVFTATASTEFKNRDGKSASLGEFSVGEKVKAEGRVINGTLQLDKLEAEED